MIAFRWLIGVLSGLLAAGSLICFLIFLVFDFDVWLERARTLRRGIFSALLLWFNVEIWGLVFGTLMTW